MKMIRQTQEVSDTTENKSATSNMFNSKQNNDRTTKASTSSNSSTTSAPQTPEAIAKEKYTCLIVIFGWIVFAFLVPYFISYYYLF